MKKLFLINSIYKSTEGEGVHIGTPQIFVRYQGCHVGCVNCDSMDTWEFDSEKEKSLEDILADIQRCSISEINSLPILRVSITGGDPLHPKFTPGLLDICKELKSMGYYINLEASGTRLVHEIFSIVDYISFDYKTPSTQVKTSISNLKELVKKYDGKYQIKSVISGKEDFDYCLAALKSLSAIGKRIVWCLTPEYSGNSEFFHEKLQLIMRLNESVGGPFRVVAQQHKWAYGPLAKEV